MNKYLKMLKSPQTDAPPQNTEMRRGTELTKLPEDPSVSSVSGCDGSIGKCASPDGELVDPETGASYWPWGPYLTPECLKEWQHALFEVVDELARLERWPDSDYDHVMMCILRQPVSTLRPDLAYFQCRLVAARADHAAREAMLRRSWRYDR